MKAITSMPIRLQLICALLTTGWTLHVPKNSKYGPFISVTVRRDSGDERKIVDLDRDDVIDLFNTVFLEQKGEYKGESGVDIVAYTIKE